MLVSTTKSRLFSVNIYFEHVSEKINIQSLWFFHCHSQNGYFKVTISSILSYKKTLIAFLPSSVYAPKIKKVTLSHGLKVFVYFFSPPLCPFRIAFTFFLSIQNCNAWICCFIFMNSGFPFVHRKLSLVICFSVSAHAILALLRSNIYPICVLP